MRRIGRDMLGEQAELLVEAFRAQAPRSVVDAGDIRLVVIHRSAPPSLETPQPVSGSACHTGACPRYPANRKSLGQWLYGFL